MSSMSPTEKNADERRWSPFAALRRLYQRWFRRRRPNRHTDTYPLF